MVFASVPASWRWARLKSSCGVALLSVSTDGKAKLLLNYPSVPSEEGGSEGGLLCPTSQSSSRARSWEFILMTSAGRFKELAPRVRPHTSDLCRRSRVDPRLRRSPGSIEDAVVGEHAVLPFPARTLPAPALCQLHQVTHTHTHTVRCLTFIKIKRANSSKVVQCCNNTSNKGLTAHSSSAPI